MKFIGYTLENGHVETEYLKRELNLHIATISSEKLISSFLKTEKIILVISNPKLYKKFLSTYQGIAYIFLLSDEKIELRKNVYFLFKAKRIKVIRNYYIKPIKLKKHFENIFYFLLISNSLDLKRIFQIMLDFLCGVIKIIYLNIFRVMTKNYLVLPLGYTNNFANEFSNLLQIEDSNKSLLLLSYSIKKSGTYSSFIGQAGNIYRQEMLNYFQKQYNIKYKIQDKFQGFNGIGATDYTNNLLKSDFSIVPFGSSNMETFRFTESVIANSFPICFPSSITIPTDLPLYKKSFESWYTNKIHDYRSLNIFFKESIVKEIHRINNYLQDAFSEN